MKQLIIMKRTILLLAFIFAANYIWGQDLSIEVSGDANFENAQYVVTEAGEDFPSSITSSSSIYLSLNYRSLWDGIFGRDIPWQIFIHKSDLGWNNNLDLQIQRDGNGSRASLLGPNPIVTSGTNYQSVTNNPTFFFRGRYGVRNIPLILKLSGASLTMGARQFETSLVFTVYDD